MVYCAATPLGHSWLRGRSSSPPGGGRNRRQRPLRHGQASREEARQGGRGQRQIASGSEVGVPAEVARSWCTLRPWTCTGCSSTGISRGPNEPAAPRVRTRRGMRPSASPGTRGGRMARCGPITAGSATTGTWAIGGGRRSPRQLPPMAVASGAEPSRSSTGSTSNGGRAPRLATFASRRVRGSLRRGRRDQARAMSVTACREPPPSPSPSRTEPSTFPG